MKARLIHKDSRGSLYNVVNSGRWADVNFVKSEKGIERGGHYHKKAVEGFFIVEGRVEVAMENVKTGESAKFTAGELDYFEVKPYWMHILKTLEPSKWVALLSEKFDEEKPDIHKVN